FFVELGEETARFAPVDSRESLDDAVAKLGLPLVLKTRRLGYDGQGQLTLTPPFELDRAWRELGDSPLIAEQWVPFVRELSIIAVRGRDGTIACYPLVENTHHGGILRSSLAPVPELAAQTQAAAERCAIRVLEALDYVGVLAIELFDEMAPRGHTSGHLTIEGAVTSQFENHVRAILGLPLGDTSIPRPAVMVN